MDRTTDTDKDTLFSSARAPRPPVAAPLSPLCTEHTLYAHVALRQYPLAILPSL